MDSFIETMIRGFNKNVDFKSYSIVFNYNNIKYMLVCESKVENKKFKIILYVNNKPIVPIMLQKTTDKNTLKNSILSNLSENFDVENIFKS